MSKLIKLFICTVFTQVLSDTNISLRDYFLETPSVQNEFPEKYLNALKSSFKFVIDHDVSNIKDIEVLSLLNRFDNIYNASIFTAPVDKNLLSNVLYRELENFNSDVIKKFLALLASDPVGMNLVQDVGNINSLEEFDKSINKLSMFVKDNYQREYGLLFALININWSSMIYLKGEEFFEEVVDINTNETSFIKATSLLKDRRAIIGAGVILAIIIWKLFKKDERFINLELEKPEVPVVTNKIDAAAAGPSGNIIPFGSVEDASASDDDTSVSSDESKVPEEMDAAVAGPSVATIPSENVEDASVSDAQLVAEDLKTNENQHSKRPRKRQFGTIKGNKSLSTASRPMIKGPKGNQ